MLNKTSNWIAQAAFSDTGPKTSTTTEKYKRFSRPLHGFTLRTLLIATTLVAVILGAIAYATK